MGSNTTWITPPEFDLSNVEVIDVYDNGMHLQSWIMLPNGVSLEAQFIALRDEDEDTFAHESELDDFLTTSRLHGQVRRDVSACAHYVRVKGRPHLYKLMCWPAPLPPLTILRKTTAPKE